jgi:anti-anti-sigma factor
LQIARASSARSETFGRRSHDPPDDLQIAFREELYLMHTLELIGDLDGASAPTLEAAIEELCETKTIQITFDLSKLTQIDDTGVAVIAFRCGWCQRRGHEVALICGPRPIQRAFELAGLGERLPFLANSATSAQAEELPVPVGAREPLDERLACDATPEPRTRSLTLPRAAGRSTRARRARRRLAEEV